jgi:hypothetical protein
VQIHVIILKNYFTFEKQDLFYYQWYADYLHDCSRKKRADNFRFYNVKNKHETMISRQDEGMYSRQAILHQRHWDYQEMLNQILYPTFTNILDPKNALIKEPENFKKAFAWFMM